MYEWQYYNTHTCKWETAERTNGETFFTFDLPILAEKPAKASITWGSVDQATEYIVEILDNDKWIPEATTKSLSYEFEPKANTEYQFRIKAVSENGTSSLYAYKTLTTDSKFVEDKGAYTYEEPVRL